MFVSVFYPFCFFSLSLFFCLGGVYNFLSCFVYFLLFRLCITWTVSIYFVLFLSHSRCCYFYDYHCCCCSFCSKVFRMLVRCKCTRGKRIHTDNTTGSTIGILFSVHELLMMRGRKKEDNEGKSFARECFIPNEVFLLKWTVLCFGYVLRSVFVYCLPLRQDLYDTLTV